MTDTTDSDEPRQRSLAERQLDNARHDPRLDRGPAAIADWWDAVEAAERARTFSILGLYALRDTGSTESEGSQRSRAHQERAMVAEAEIQNEFAELNAQALVALMSALDALVETLVPRAREMLVRFTVDKGIARAAAQEPRAHAAVPIEVLEKIKDAAAEVLGDRLGKIKRARGGGAKRWEEVLRAAALSAPPDREIPSDLDLALVELVSIRHILVHRAGRMDDKALTEAPSLNYNEGQLVRISSPDYQLYSAAIRSYGDEVVWRFSRGLGLQAPALDAWRDNYLVGV